MTLTKKSKELLERYLAAAGKYLPIKNRTDISREIESLILDICEERWPEMEVDQQKMESVLVELGKPSKLAAKYKTEVLLIGPELIPVFKLVLMIVCTVTSIVSLSTFFIGSSPMTAGEIAAYFIELFNSLFGVVGFIFIIFVILERIIPNKGEFNPLDQSWNIKDLPDIKEKIPSKAEIITGIFFSIIAIIALNVFTDYIGIYSFGSEGMNFLPILAPELIQLLPLFSLRIAIGAMTLLPFIISRSAELTRSGSYYYNISQMGLSLFDIGILILFLKRGIESFLLVDNFAKAGFDEIFLLSGTLFKGILILLLCLSIFSLVKRTLVILPKRHV
ncbi:MAG: hypothetical protein JEZ04_13970 [Spirochaetales bacterium]|nr:hypothetical protein [Spirochaetales bacterium]